MDAEPLPARMGRWGCGTTRSKASWNSVRCSRSRAPSCGRGSMRRGLTFGAGAIGGLLLGGVLTLAIQASTLPVPPGSRARTAPPVTRPSAPETFLAWVPRGLPDGFAERVRRLPSIGRITVVAEDNVWLARSWSAAGEMVDRPTRPYRIPLDAAAVDPSSFAPFLPPPDRNALAAVENGEGILGSTSASVRGLGPGAILDFGKDRRSGSLPCFPTSWSGRPSSSFPKPPVDGSGSARDRYLLVQPARGHRLTSRTLRRAIQPLVPRHLGVFGRVQVRAPGETPYFRAGDAVLPPVLLKALFGEFAARTLEGQPGSIEVDPEWRRTHLHHDAHPPRGAGDVSPRDRPSAPGRDGRAPVGGPRTADQVVQRMLRAAVHQPRSHRDALPSHVGHRHRHEPRFRQLLRRSAASRSASRRNAGAMGVHVGRHLRRARREPLRIPSLTGHRRSVGRRLARAATTLGLPAGLGLLDASAQRVHESPMREPGSSVGSSSRSSILSGVRSAIIRRRPSR